MLIATIRAASGSQAPSPCGEISAANPRTAAAHRPGASAFRPPSLPCATAERLLLLPRTMEAHGSRPLDAMDPDSCCPSRHPFHSILFLPAFPSHFLTKVGAHSTCEAGLPCSGRFASYPVRLFGGLSSFFSPRRASLAGAFGRAAKPPIRRYGVRYVESLSDDGGIGEYVLSTGQLSLLQS